MFCSIDILNSLFTQYNNCVSNLINEPLSTKYLIYIVLKVLVFM